MKRSQIKHSIFRYALVNTLNFLSWEGAEICYSFRDLPKRKIQFADRGMKLKKFSFIYLERYFAASQSIKLF